MIGINNGKNCRVLKEKFGEYINLVGIDISEEALKLVKPFYDKVLQIDIENEDIDKLLEDQKFDYIVAIEILEHLFKPELLISKTVNI